MCVSEIVKTGRAREWLSDDLTELWEDIISRLLLIGLPVHDKSMGDDHLFQIILIMPGDTEKVQLVAFLIIGDLQREEDIHSTLRKSGWHWQLTCSKDVFKSKGSFRFPLATLKPLDHLFITWLRRFGDKWTCGMSTHSWSGKDACHLLSVRTGLITVSGEQPQPHPDKWTSCENTKQIPRHAPQQTAPDHQPHL